MTTHLRFTIVATALVAFASACAAQETLPFPDEYNKGWMAKVNGKVITKDQVLAKIGKRIEGLRNAKAGRPDEFQSEFLKLYNSTLWDLVREEVVKQKAKSFSFQISEAEVDQRQKEFIKERADGDREKFKAMLAESDLTLSEWREGVKAELTMETVLDATMNRTAVFVQPALALAYFNEHPGEFENPERVRLRVLRVKAGRGALERARRLAESLRRQVEAGADFADLTKWSDTDIQQDAPVDLQWRTRADLEPALAEEVFKAAEGSLVGPVMGDSGVYLARVEGREEARKISYEDAQQAIIVHLRREMWREEMGEASLRLMRESVIEFSIRELQQSFQSMMDDLQGK